MPDSDQEVLNSQPFSFRSFTAPPGSVLPLLRRFARESCASFDDIVARFFGAALSGEFDHLDQDDPAEKTNCELAISFRFSFPAPIGRHRDSWGYRTQPINREDFLGWLSDWGLLPRPIGVYRKLFSGPEAPDTAETYKISADILSQCLDGDHLYSLLRALRIDKHDFARWAIESLKHSPPMLAAIGADPVCSWRHHVRRSARLAAAERMARSDGLAQTFIQGLRTLDPDDNPNKIIGNLRSIIEDERKLGKTHFKQGAVAKFLKATIFPTKSETTLRRWVRTASAG